MNTSCRRTTAVSCLTVLTLLIIAGCQNPADDVAGAKVSPPKAETSTPAATSTSPKDSTSREVPKDSVPLEISSQTSKIEFVGSKVTGSHTGGFKSVEGTWYVADRGPNPAAAKTSGAGLPASRNRGSSGRPSRSAITGPSWGLNGYKRSTVGPLTDG